MYWERQSEINISGKSSSTHTSASASSADHLPTLDAFPFPSHSLPPSDELAENSAENPENIGDHGPDLPHSGTSVPQFAYIADFLGPDGKLKPGERKRRFDNGLCLCCGEPGHRVSNCPGTLPIGQAVASAMHTPAPASASTSAFVSVPYSASDLDSSSTSDSDYVPSESDSDSDYVPSANSDSHSDSASDFASASAADSESASAPGSGHYEPYSDFSAESASDAESA
jgi:hypothetical protein